MGYIVRVCKPDEGDRRHFEETDEICSLLNSIFFYKVILFVVLIKNDEEHTVMEEFRSLLKHNIELKLNEYIFSNELSFVTILVDPRYNHLLIQRTRKVEQF